MLDFAMATIYQLQEKLLGGKHGVQKGAESKEMYLYIRSL